MSEFDLSLTLFTYLVGAVATGICLIIADRREATFEAALLSMLFWPLVWFICFRDRLKRWP